MSMTVGVEIETTNLPMRMWQGLRLGWDVVTDGSIRTIQTRYFPIEGVYKVRQHGEEKFGAEMVSPPMTCGEDMWPYLNEVFGLIQSSGEVARANNSIHIHVGMKDWRLATRNWKFLEKVDKLLFDISAPGGIPRGGYNDFIYYRPLVSPQWACTDLGGYTSSIGNIEQVRNLDELKFVMGRYDNNPPKWYPARYCGINLVSWFKHGTLEFRHFNFTHDFMQFKIWVLFCVGIVKSLMEGVETLDLERLLFKGSTECGCQKSFPKLLDKVELNPIYEDIDLTPILTHTKQMIYWKEPGVDKGFDRFIPTTVLPRVREVNDAHPSNSLSVDKFTVYGV